jgi:hypothetical protein
MKDKILTADDFCKDLQSEYEETGEYKMYFAIDIPNKLREFARYHVNLALIAASESHFCEGDIHECTPLPENILDSYPENNIK